jgi:2'-5' RNA ligase
VESRAPSRLRLFVALELPDDAREAIVDWQHHAFGGHSRSARLVRPEALHVTLVFLGHHPEAELGAIRDAALSGVAPLPAPALSVAALKSVPPRRARLWALDLDDPQDLSTAVHAAVASPLIAGGWYEPEKRPFWPHLTVARVRAREKPPRIDADPPSLSFVASEVVLYRSRLSRAGADYEPLARATLGG